MKTSDVFDDIEELFPKLPLDIIEETPLKLWDNFKKKGISPPSNLESIISNHYEFYFDCFKRILKYNRSGKYHLGIYGNLTFNAKSDIICGEKVIFVDEYLIAFLFQFILGLFHLTYNASIPLSSNEKNKCEDFLIFQLNHFHDRDGIILNDKIEYDDFFDFLASKEPQFSIEAAIGAKAIFYFIISHELGHFYFNHIEVEVDLDKLNKTNTQKEFAADNYAFNLFIELINDFNTIEETSVQIEFSQFPFLFFNILDFYYQIFPEQNNSHNNHPHPLERIERLKLDFSNKIDSKSKKLYEDLLDGLNNIKINFKNKNN